MHLVKQRSILITLIRALLVKVCPNVNPDEYFLTPHQVYPPICTAKVTIGEVACAVLHSDRTIPFEFDKGATAQQVLFEDLLYFDSFHTIEDKMLQGIFLHKTSNNLIPLATMTSIHHSLNVCQELAKRLEDESGQVKRDMTYSQLYGEILQYTIFTGENLHVSLFIQFSIYSIFSTANCIGIGRSCSQTTMSSS